MTSIWSGSHVKSAGKYVDSPELQRATYAVNGDQLLLTCYFEGDHLRLLYDIRKLLFDIANETAYTMDSMEVVLEHSIHSRNPYLNEICREMGEGLQKKERGCGQELWQERIEAWQKTLGLTSGGKEIFAGQGSGRYL